MPTETTNRSLFGISVVALLTTAILIGVIVISAMGVWQFWSTASVTCVECLKSFAKTFIEPRHLLLSVLFVWSSYRLTKVLRFVLREWWFSRSLRSLSRTDEGVYLLPSTIHAAWSAGIFSQAICASKDFWSRLSSEEREALVAHESWHLQQGDVWLFFLLGYVQEVFADPLSRRLLSVTVKRLHLERETYADQAAIAKTSEHVLGGLLLKALLFEGQAPLASPGLETVIHERVRALRGEGVQLTGVSWSSFAPALFLGMMVMGLPLVFPPMVQCLFT
jgi:Zn-dependent protease with chaperone function